MKQITTDFFDIVRDTVVDAEEAGKDSGYSEGALTAFHCYEGSEMNCSMVNGRFMFECDKLPERDQIGEFFEMLHEAELTEAAVTAKEGIFDFIRHADAYGWKVSGGCYVERHLFKDQPPTIIPGILLQC